MEMVGYDFLGCNNWQHDFTACSDDDEPSNENPVLGTTGKRLDQELENGNPDDSFTYYMVPMAG